MSTGRAHPQPSLGGPRLGPVAGGAHELLPPAEPRQVLAARLLGREARFELPERARVVLHSLNHYRLGLLESRTYPKSVLSPFRMRTVCHRVPTRSGRHGRRLPGPRPSARHGGASPFCRLTVPTGSLTPVSRSPDLAPLLGAWKWVRHDETQLPRPGHETVLASIVVGYASAGATCSFAAARIPIMICRSFLPRSVTWSAAESRTSTRTT